MTNQINFNEGQFESKSKNWRLMMMMWMTISLVNDQMRRENAIANDYWYPIFKQNKVDQIALMLQRIEEK